MDLNKSWSMTPEAPTVTTAASSGGTGPSGTLPAGQATAQPKRKGIMGLLETVFTPEAGSFWDSAWKNGLMGAKSGQASYAAATAANTADIGAKNAEAALRNAQATKALNAPVIAGNNVIVQDPGAPGGVRIMTPPQQPGETERLIDKWHAAKQAGDNMSAMIYERAIKGAQYSPEVIAAQGAARTATVVAGKKAQRFAPRAAGGGSAGATKVPTGFILNP